MSADKEATTMGREKASAAIERRETITGGDRLLADALIDGAEQYGRYDATSAEYDPAGGQCAGCIFYRGDEYAGLEGCVIVAADVQPGGGCRLAIEGQLPGALEDEAPGMPSDDGEMEDEQSLDDAREDVDEALDLGESDEDDDEDDEDEDTPPSGGVNVTINIDLDNGENHNAEGGSIAVSDGDVETSDADAAPFRSRETHTSRSAKAEWRESGAGAQYRTLSGYASVFNTPSEDLGGFREIIAPGAFTRALESADLNVCLLWNHDPDTVMASTRNGTLELAQDKKGLRMWARVDMADFDAQRVVGKIRSGLVDQMSFAFTIAEDGDEWDVRDGKPFRTVRDVNGLYDVSAVTWPAYPVGTKVELLDRALRSGRVPDARALVAQADPAGTTSSLSTEGEALRRLKARAKSRLAIVKFDLTR
jgi:HK97 family phage prohead protease